MEEITIGEEFIQRAIVAACLRAGFKILSLQAKRADVYSNVEAFMLYKLAMESVLKRAAIMDIDPAGGRN